MTNTEEAAASYAAGVGRILAASMPGSAYVVIVQMEGGALHCASSPDCKILDEIRAKTEATIALSGPLGEILHERVRQISKGYDATHDDQHVDRELVTHPIYGAIMRLERANSLIDDATHRSNMVEAAAMLIAEIERVDRANAAQEG